MKRSSSRQQHFAFVERPKQGPGLDGHQRTGWSSRRFQGKATAGKTKEDDASRAGESRFIFAVAQLSNLDAALRHVMRNKGAHGVDGKSVEQVGADRNRLLPRLRRAILERSYMPGDVRRVWIPKPGGGQRGLGIPNVIDRVVQQAVLQILEPVFEPGFHDSSHGFRRGRSAHDAVAQAARYVADGYDWIVSVDLSKFFDRVNHQRLLARMGQKMKDPAVLKLVNRMLKASVVMPDGTRVRTDEGTPQGGPLSPLLSNIVLDELDWELDRRGLRFVRYADDFNVFVRSKRSADRVMAALSRFIVRRLRLKVNGEKSKVARPEDVHFLGFNLRKHIDSPKVDILLSKRTRKRIKDKIRELTPRNWGAPLASCMERISSYIKGWVGYFRICSLDEAKWFLRGWDRHIRRRIRAIIIHQRKKPRNLYRLLIGRGVKPRTAWKAVYLGGPWARSKSNGMNMGFRNKWFEEQMDLLWPTWLKHNPQDTTEVPTRQQILPGRGY